MIDVCSQSVWDCFCFALIVHGDAVELLILNGLEG